jgi:predicted dehydrogenase
VHAQHVLSALQHKLPVYCEKPLALDLPLSRECARAANLAGVLTHTAFTMRYIPAVWQAKAIIASGALGEIYNFRAHFFHNSYMDASRPMSWRLRSATSGGGSLADLGIHIIDMARHLLGDAAWVSCQTRTFIKNRPVTAGSAQTEPVDVDDWALCQLGLANGAPGSIEVTRMSGGAGESCRFDVFGSLGSVEIDLDQTAHVRWYDHRSKRITFGSADLPAPPGERAISEWLPNAKLSLGWFRDAHIGCIQDFLLDLAENKPSSADFSAAVKAQEILTAAYLSAGQDGARVNLPLP